MKRIIVFILIFTIFITVLCGEERRPQSTIDETKITISVPSYDKDGNLKYDKYKKRLPQNLDEAKEDIGIILSTYNSTSNSYVDHVEKLEAEIASLKKQLDETKKLYEESKKIKEEAVGINSDLKKNNSEALSLFPRFGVSLFYGTGFKNFYNLGVMTGDIYFGNIKLSVGPMLNMSQDEDKTINTNLGLVFGLGYKF